MKKTNYLNKKRYLKNALSVVTIALASLLTAGESSAQADCYNFTQFVGTYQPISGGNVFQSGASYNTSYARTIGFDFDFMDLEDQTDLYFYRYGYLKFGPAYSSSSIFTTSATNADNVIAALHYFHYPSASAARSVRDVTLGVAPNRVYVCEVRDWSRLSGDADQRFNYQFRLYEGTNIIELHYGYFNCPETYNNFYTIGIKGDGASDYNNRECDGSWFPSTAATSNGRRVDVSPTSLPPSGLVYRWERQNVVMADFSAPGEAFVGSLVKYTSLNPGFKIEWDKNDDNSVESTANEYSTTYATAGTYTMKMVAYNCIVADTIRKDIVVKDPTSVPVADFVVDDNDVMIYDNIQFYDLSTQGPSFWQWLLFDSADSAGTVEIYSGNDPLTDANLLYGTTEAINFSVCLRTSNALGFSTEVCKYDYVKVNALNLFSMGPIDKSDERSGTLTDNSGPDFNYSNGRYDDFLIAPCNAEKIILDIKQFKVADNGDRMLVYDGPDANGKPLHPLPNGFDFDNPPPKELVATSGAMLIYFITDGGGTDSGFIADWSIEEGASGAPVASFTHPDTIYTGVPNNIINTTGARGEVFHTWTVQGDPMTYSDENLENYTFATSGNRNVCLKDSTCLGKDEYCKDVFVFTPAKPINLDFVADQRRVKAVEDIVTISAVTEQATNYEWTFFPDDVTYKNGTNNGMKDIQVSFNNPGPYTITLRAWNSIGGQANTQKIVLKDDYVIAVEYCRPIPQIVSSDIGITEVVLKSKPNMGAPVTLIENESEAGVEAYTDYTEDEEVPAAALYFGAEYDLTVKRATPAVNPVSRKAWIDFNIDGQFDATETVLDKGASNSVQAKETFKMPTLSEAFEGQTRMRVSAVYNNQVNNSCGTGNGATPLVGEYEDYRVDLTIDPDQPVITLKGNDTVFIEVDQSYMEEGADVEDPTQGDISDNLVITGSVDTAQTGLHRLTYSAVDASGNRADDVIRVVIVVVDNTAPQLDLNGADTVTIEVFDEYTELGAMANDSKDGILTTAIKIDNQVDNTVLGFYPVIYTVADNQGNLATKTRIVEVVDTQKPEILALGSDNVQVGTAFVDMTTVSDNYDNNPDFTVTGEIVNPNVIGEYQVTYTAVDGSGNVADVLVRTYKVDDFIAPNFNLSSSDDIIHDVRTPFNDVTKVIDLEENYYDLDQVKVTSDYSQVDVNTLGTYTMSVTASDPSGNTKTRTRDVKVVDRKAPTIFGAVELEVKLYDTFWVYEGLKTLDNYYSPDVLLPLIRVIDNNVNVYEEGVYYATFALTDPSGNQAKLFTRTIRVCAECETTTGIDNVDEGIKSINVYPNPSTGLFNIDFELNSTEDATIEIYSVTGQKVKTMELGKTNNAKGLVLDLNDQHSGVYFIRLITQNAVVTKKITIKK